jgi:MATE family multidrug resistance protein
VISLPIGGLLAFQFDLGAEGIWIGLLSGLTITAVAMVYRFHKLSEKLSFPSDD